MNKKYTVFISSTYKDLVKERQKVIDVVLQSDCVPVGMEYFNAADDEQFEIIKRLIDDCDYYILIIGGRYGSLHPDTGISYTEMEYDYAVEQGIPVLVFVHSDIALFPDCKRDNETTLFEKLEVFKQRAMNNRMAKMWDTHEKLLVGVVVSLLNAKNDYDRPGWIRGTNIENENLSKPEIDINKMKEIDFTYSYLSQNMQTGYIAKGNIKGKLDEAFESVALKTHGIITFNQIGQAFLEITRTITKHFAPLWSMSISDTEIIKAISQMIAFDLLEYYENNNEQGFRLTEKGLKIRNELVIPKS
ncbi:MAG: DUF4062 domain-containing protein [Defluviitaleaceae bacterium]|nr:DUF4062 domain-containing protein [Defluviitaleaceae bacterium]